MFLNGPPGDNRLLAEHSKWLGSSNPSPHAKESFRRKGANRNEAAFRSWKTGLKTTLYPIKSYS